MITGVYAISDHDRIVTLEVENKNLRVDFERFLDDYNTNVRDHYKRIKRNRVRYESSEASNKNSDIVVYGIQGLIATVISGFVAYSHKKNRKG